MSENRTIVLVCPKCDKRVETQLQEYDYPEAVELRGISCPDCWNGEFDIPDYRDINGNPVDYDPDLITSRST